MKFIKFKKKSPMIERNTDLSNILKVGVTGMTCNHCKANVETNLMNIPGIDYVNADPDHSEVIINGDNIDIAKIKETVENIGYSFKGKLDS